MMSRYPTLEILSQVNAIFLKNKKLKQNASVIRFELKVMFFIANQTLKNILFLVIGVTY